MDFIQAAHELFRRHPNVFRHYDFVQGLYIGMDEPELRDYMTIRGEHDTIPTIEAAAQHDGRYMVGGHAMPTERPTSGFVSCYHLSVGHLCRPQYGLDGLPLAA